LHLTFSMSSEEDFEMEVDEKMIYAKKDCRIAVYLGDSTIQVKTFLQDDSEETVQFLVSYIDVISLKWYPSPSRNTLAVWSIEGYIEFWDESKANSVGNPKEYKLAGKMDLKFRHVDNFDFASHHFGFIIAIWDVKKEIHLYQAPDELDLNRWIRLTTIPLSMAIDDWLVWSSDRNAPPMLVVSVSDKSFTGKKLMSYLFDSSVQYYTEELIENPAFPYINKVQFSPVSHESDYEIAIASEVVHVMKFKLNRPIDKEREKNLQLLAHETLGEDLDEYSSVSYNGCGSLLLAVPNGDFDLKLFQMDKNNKWSFFRSMKKEAFDDVEAGSSNLEKDASELLLEHEQE
ncbi:Nucleoporin SEH1, partial [Trichinella papuae]